MKVKIISENPLETRQIAGFFIRFLFRQKKLFRKQATIVSLEGNLGSGKTEFLKGVAEELNLKEQIFSPTFLIMKQFPLSHKTFHSLWHLDCYRLKSPQELKELDFPKLLADPHNLIFIEWGNKIRKLLPPQYGVIKFKVKGENQRELEFSLPFLFPFC